MEDTELTDTDTLMFTDTTARGPLIPSPRLMLMPTMVSMAMDWVTTDWDTELTDTPMLTTATTTARGPLTPSLRLMPMPLWLLWLRQALRIRIQIRRIQRILLRISSQDQKYKAEAQSEHHSLLSDLISFSAPLPGVG